MNDFYFIYYTVGPQFIKTMMETFKYVPKNANIIVMTPTPELLSECKVDFNLIVLNSDDLIDDFSREHEPVIKEVDNNLYIEKLINNYKTGKRFSANTHRYILPWLIKHNITKFAILDTDCLINYFGEYETVLNHLNTEYSNKNVFFGPIMHWNFDNQHITFNYEELFQKENVNFNLTPKDKLVVFDGWMRGFWFQDTKHIQTFFNLWDGIIKKSYQLNLNVFSGNVWTVPDEWIHGFISNTMNKQFNIDIEDIVCHGFRLCKHIYHPENDFFNLHHTLYTDTYGLKTASSRDEFFIKNKDNLIKFYENQNGIARNRMSEVIYDYPSVE